LHDSRDLMQRGVLEGLIIEILDAATCDLRPAPVESFGLQLHLLGHTASLGTAQLRAALRKMM
jgi:hypothetical protein